MAKKSIKKKIEIELEMEMPMGRSIPNPPHRLDEAKSRNEMLSTYSNLEKKRDWHDQDKFREVESPFSSFYGGLDPRRRNEVADGGMVKEEHGMFSNCSDRFVNREYPRAGFYANPYIDDTVKGPREVE